MPFAYPLSWVLAKRGLTQSKMSKKLIAITGGIGSGKSLVLDTFNELGYPTLSSDKIVKELYKTPKVKRLIKSIFVDAVKGEKRLKIDYNTLTELAFSDKENNQKLTKTITPLVLNEILRKAERNKKTTFVEVPLLFECGFEKEFDKVIVVLRDKNKRIESVKLRSKLSEEHIKKRMAFQVDYDKKDFSKFIVINNDKDKEQLKKQVFALIKKISE